MDRWIQWVLGTAWAVFAIALLIWWWRRQHGSQRYPYSERAVTINKAIDEASDLVVIYWSKQEKRFQRRVLTPLELDGYTLKAFDHQLNDVRGFQVTRIKAMEIMVRGSGKVPSLRSTATPAWVLGGLGVVAVAFLSVALYRGNETSEELLPPPPLPASALPPVASTTTVTSAAAAPSETSMVTSVTDDDIPEEPATNVAPVPPVPLPTSPSQDRWEVVVYDHPSYDTNFVAKILQQLLNCSPPVAEQYVRQIRSAGRVKIWEGKRTTAEVLRQTLEAENLITKSQLGARSNPPDSPTAN